MAKQMSLGSLEGRRSRIHGLALAAQKAMAREQNKAIQLELFDKLKPEDSQYKN